MDRETVAAFREAAGRFASRVVRPAVGTEGRDGPPGRFAAAFDAAREAGFVASPDPDDPGYEFGVWGTAAATGGPAGSLAVLEELAVECAGFAMAVHTAGLGVMASGGRREARLAVAFLAADRRATAFPGVGRGIRTWNPVVLPPGCDSVILHTGGSRRRLVALDDPALVVRDLTPRTGLAAVRIVSIGIGRENPGEPLESASPETVAIPWLAGLAAIAAGTARGSVAVASAHAGERRQGGRFIAEHPAVRILLGDAVSRVEAARAQVEVLGGSTPGIATAMAARLRVVEDAFQATTDAMQVLGGYGYMEDYRIEKRLRDLMTIRGLPPTPDEIRILLAGNTETRP